MKKKTKRLMKELGKSRRQRNRENFLAEKKRKFPAQKRKGGIKKNYHVKHKTDFEIGGKRHLKFIKLTPLTGELKRLLGRVAAKLPKKETKEITGALPLLSVWYDTKYNQLILRHDGVIKHEDNLVLYEDGSAVLIPDENYAKARY